MSRRDCIFSFHRRAAKDAENLSFAFAGEKPAKAKTSAAPRQGLVALPAGQAVFRAAVNPAPLPLSGVTAVRKELSLSASSVPRAKRTVS